MRRGGTRSLLAALLITSLALAGCTGGDEPQEVDETGFEGLDAEVTEDTGALRVVVVDEAIRPIAGATVTATGPGGEERTGTTSEQGAVAIGRLPAGTYALRASKLGYLDVTSQSDVVAGLADPPPVRMLLTVDPEALPSVETFKFDGFIECSFSLVVLRFAACDLMPDGVSNEAFWVEYQFDGQPAWIQSELVWESTQQLGSEMQLSVTDFGANPQKRIGAADGESPVLLVMNTTLIHETGLGKNVTGTWRVFNDGRDETDVWPDDEVQDAWAGSLYGTYNGTAPQEVKDEAYMLTEDCIKYPTLFDACFGMGATGATIQQEFTIFTHAFHNFVPDAEWRFTMDGAHPYPA